MVRNLESEPTAMPPKTLKALLVPAAFVLFLSAAEHAAGLTWYGTAKVVASAHEVQARWKLKEAAN
jgi:hypothetical protein